MGTNTDKFSRIVHSATKLTLLGGAPASREDLEAALTLAPDLICADGGANQAALWGVEPAGVIGDLDSADAADMQARDWPVIRDPDQNSTDFEKCLGLVAASLVIGVGFVGGRVDHQLAVLNGLAKFREKRVVLIGPHDVIFYAPLRFEIELTAGERVSVFPLTDVDARSFGLRWPIDGLALNPVGQIGCSNAAEGGKVVIEVDHGDLLVILPRDRLSAVVRALSKPED